MERRILFRGKDKLGNWHFGSLQVDTLGEENKHFINERITIDEPNFIEVRKETVGQLTDSVDIDGEDIWEGSLVNQKSVLLGDKDIDFTGYVKFYEGRWWVDSGKDAIPLWSEHRENTVVEDY